jgi:hypothetical protein
VRGRLPPLPCYTAPAHSPSLWGWCGFRRAPLGARAERIFFKKVKAEKEKKKI